MDGPNREQKMFRVHGALALFAPSWLSHTGVISPDMSLPPAQDVEPLPPFSTGVGLQSPKAEITKGRELGLRPRLGQGLGDIFGAEGLLP